MKRTLLFLSILALFCVAIFGLEALFSSTSAQQSTASQDISVRPLPVPANFVGTVVRGASSDGNRLVFESINNYISNADVTVVNGNNADSNHEIFVYDVPSRTIVQITNTRNVVDPSDSTKLKARINCLSPAISGNGNKIVFSSNGDLGGTTNANYNYEIYTADLGASLTNPPINRVTFTGPNSGESVSLLNGLATNDSPSLSNDGSVIAFTSNRVQINDAAGLVLTAVNEGPNGSTGNYPDGNTEVMICNPQLRLFRQVTSSWGADALVNGIPLGFNSRPFISGNGQTLAFMSSFNLAQPKNNGDFNEEIYLARVGTLTNFGVNQVLQVTVTNGNTGTGTDLPALPAGNSVNVLVAGSRALSDDGSKLVFESSGNFNGTNPDAANLRTRELFLADLSTSTFGFTAITNQPSVDVNNPGRTDFAFVPSISGNGNFIVFSSILNLTPSNPSDVKMDNGDSSKELFRYDVNARTIRQLTYTPNSDSIQEERVNVSPSYINDLGDLVTFTYFAQLILPNTSLVSDLFQIKVRAVASVNSTTLAVQNAASADTSQVARGSIVSIYGDNLSALSSGDMGANPPFEFNNVTVSFNGIAARLLSVQPNQINLVIPGGIASNDSLDFWVNNNGVRAAGKVKVVDVAPGLFVGGPNRNIPSARCSRIASDGTETPVSAPPCQVVDGGSYYLVVDGTGWRNTTNVQVKIGDQTITPAFSGASPEKVGLDQVRVQLTSTLAGRTDQDLSVVATGSSALETNKAKVGFLPLAFTDETVVVDDGIPAGATAFGSPWAQVNNPAPVSGNTSLQSNGVAGLDQYYFQGADDSTQIDAGDRLVVSVYLDPANPPSEIMLQWQESNGNWEHRAYWGANNIGFGNDGTSSRRFMGPLPQTGRWVRLEVQASLVGLEGASLSGMAFTLFGGRVNFDRAGRINTDEIIWVEDSVPPGATQVSDGGDNWNFVNSDPFSGTAFHSSNIASGAHQHYFQGASQTLQINAGDRLIAQVYLDPANLPSEIMLQWAETNGSWEHRAYWGANNLNLGTDGSDSRRYQGPLPAAGRWVRLEVPASDVGLEGRTLNGMAFTLFGGRANWDRAGKSSMTTRGQTVWSDDRLPTGAMLIADGGDSWNFTNAGPDPFSGTVSHQSNIAAGIHQHYFTGASQTLSIATGDRLFAHVYLDPANLPSEIMLQWLDTDGNWDHRAYWGANNIPFGTDGTIGRRFQGPLPAAGRWVRLEVPASAVGLEGKTINGMAFTLFGGRANWDRFGKITNNDTVWLEDKVPAGAGLAADGGDNWTFIGSNPDPFSGTVSHQSNLATSADLVHQHFFVNATDTLSIAAGDRLYAYVYLDPASIPNEIMLQWLDTDGNWDHRAFWGVDMIPFGVTDTAGRKFHGPLPAAGRWVRLEVSASAVGLEGKTINGMAFTLRGGRASWDQAGKTK
ncbi:MAG TPA: hypothetical protein VJ302_10725 [Blastocatellia bacterium]|nr:hypothetical protein [Blastocatellia bacterium]